MSGGAHHNPHGRQGQPNSAWNHLQVPNFFPRQPQLAHMSSDRPLSLSPLTWHTPTTTEPPTKNTPGPLYNLQQMMLTEPRSVTQNSLDNIALATRAGLEGLGISLNRQTSLEAIQSFTRHVALPGSGMGSVDLTLSRSAPSPHSLSCSPSMIRNGQNGETSGPISLSVRDTKQINSMDTAELNKLQTGRSLEIINTSPGISQRSSSPKSPKPFKRAVKKMDSILERLNSAPADLCSASRQSPSISIQPTCEDNSSQQSHESRLPSPISSSSIVPILGSCDVQLTPVSVTDDSTESVDKLRHKRKPDKTTRIEKEDKEIPDKELALNNVSISNQTSITLNKVEIPSEKFKAIAPAQMPDSTKTTMAVQNIGPIKESSKEIDAMQKPDSVVEPNSVIIKDSKLNAAKLINTSEIINQANLIKPLKNSIEKQDFIEHQEPSVTVISSLPVSDLSSPLSKNNSIEPPTPTKDYSQSVNKLNICAVKTGALLNNTTAAIAKRRSSNEESHIIPCKIRRKTCSESETIDNIAAMIASGDDVPVVPKNTNTENSGIKDSQSLAHVLAGPVNDEDVNVASINTEKINNSKSEENPNEINLIPENKGDNMIPETTHDVPEQENNHTTKFVEVESELEKMFAGIDEIQPDEVGKISEAPQNRDNVTSTSNENKPKRKLSNTAGRVSRKSSESAENTPKKKNLDGNKKTQSPNKSKGRKTKAGKNQNTQKNSKFKAKFQDPAVKDILTYDSGSNASSNKSRGPFVQIKGPRDSPISVSIVNTSTNDEDPENRMKHTKTKKHHDDAEFRHKMRKGLHSSTLSMKYDATTTDVTWVCVFCKNGPHCGGTNLGDLFGPYLVTNGCPEFQYSQQNPEDDPFKSKRTKQDMIARNILNPNNKQIKRKRSSHSESQMIDIDIYAGMVEASPGAYEVWGHEECIIWAPGVYLVGSRVIGLEGAVWSSCRAKCNLCNLTGANVGCSQRGCDKFAHISCAARNDWSILEDMYKATCPNHHST